MAGLLVDGNWTQKDEFAEDDGKYKREDSAFRNWITADGGPGPDGQEAVKAEADRFHLYVSYACPWAHRALIFRHLKGLEDLIPVSVVHPHMLDHGWELKDDFPGATGDPLYGKSYLHEIYTRAKPDYSGKVTVPVLWDTQEEMIVNNESAEVIRIFNSAFNEITGNTSDFYPEALRGEIDEVNARVYEPVNNGVYKCGFAESQEAYDENITPLFDTLDWLEARLSDGRDFLVGNQLTEADIRLFTTLIRFDPVYFVHFKCNLKMIRQYDALNAYLQRIYEMPEVKPTVNFDHIKQHYYYSHKHINPYRIVPQGPRDLVAN
ncbi:glutathione S-transferase family protein [uncultured Hyphomonas sp.]|jgi:putative glutathione S-transferase|uniref:glutathione S-transferase family protein n=1 Tax=uncultured Hyphomonas sp. TaxID=225298 RepID=UPI000C5ADEED|nr:glutathione-dependent reductase [Hyphomonadaceae bacterium]MBL4878814.1 glutathione S-transferase family protein [Hyphomonas sp.]|tara:strand:+ start:156023 stop:156985 length:963 start_codon:yes stop_codon:yes gene_type:complete